jgi:hypothetical protein
MQAVLVLAPTAVPWVDILVHACRWAQKYLYLVQGSCTTTVRFTSSAACEPPKRELVAGATDPRLQASLLFSQVRRACIGTEYGVLARIYVLPERMLEIASQLSTAWCLGFRAISCTKGRVASVGFCRPQFTRQTG